MDEIILVGAGGHARACIDVIEQENKFVIAGLVEKNSDNSKENIGYPILGTDEDLEKLHEKYQYALVTVGQIKTPKIKINLFKKLKLIGYTLPVIISSHAYVSKHATISEGTIIMHGAIVNAGAGIGANCIINNKSLVEQVKQLLIFLRIYITEYIQVITI